MFKSKLALFGGEPIRKTPYPTYNTIDENEKKAVLEVLETGVLSGFVGQASPAFYGGKKIQELEKKWADYFGVKHAIAVNSATSGLHAAIFAASLGPGDEVITTPLTMSACTSSILQLNAVPIFADVEYDFFTISPDSIRQKITDKTKAILAVNIAGQSCEWDEILDIAKEYKLTVIEDNAQAPGGKYKNRYLGTIGDLGIFSLNCHKTIQCGEGGIICTNNDTLALKCRLFRNHGEACLLGFGLQDTIQMAGLNYRMTEIEAAISICQLEKLSYLNAPRIAMAEYLNKKLSGFSGITPPKVRPNTIHVFYIYLMLFDREIVRISRDLFCKALYYEGIPFFSGWGIPLYYQPIFEKKNIYGKGCPFECPHYGIKINYAENFCKNAEDITQKFIWTNLCRWPFTLSEADEIAKAFEKIYENLDELRDYELTCSSPTTR